jgi:hypothetical protein
VSFQKALYISSVEKDSQPKYYYLRKSMQRTASNSEIRQGLSRIFLIKKIMLIPKMILIQVLASTISRRICQPCSENNNNNNYQFN